MQPASSSLFSFPYYLHKTLFLKSERSRELYIESNSEKSGQGWEWRSLQLLFRNNKVICTYIHSFGFSSFPFNPQKTHLIPPSILQIFENSNNIHYKASSFTPSIPSSIFYTIAPTQNKRPSWSKMGSHRSFKTLPQLGHQASGMIKWISFPHKDSIQE